MPDSESQTPFEVAWGFIVAFVADTKAIVSEAVALARAGDDEGCRAGMQTVLKMLETLPGLWLETRDSSWVVLDEPIRAFSVAYRDCVRQELRFFDKPDDASEKVVTVLFNTQVQKAKTLTSEARTLTASLGGSPTRIKGISFDAEAKPG